MFLLLVIVMVVIHLQVVQLQFYVCCNRYAISTSAACRYGRVDLLLRWHCFGTGILLL